MPPKPFDWQAVHGLVLILAFACLGLLPSAFWRWPMPQSRLGPVSVVPPGFGRLHARAAALLGLVVFSAYVFVLAPCIAGVRSASGQRMDY